MLFWVIAIALLWARPQWWLLALLCFVQASLLVALVWSSSGFYREAIERYPEIMGEHWAALVASVPLNVALFAIVGGVLVLSRKIAAGWKRASERSGDDARAAYPLEDRATDRDRARPSAQVGRRNWIISLTVAALAFVIVFVARGFNNSTVIEQWAGGYYEAWFEVDDTYLYGMAASAACGLALYLLLSLPGNERLFSTRFQRLACVASVACAAVLLLLIGVDATDGRIHWFEPLESYRPLDWLYHIDIAAMLCALAAWLGYASILHPLGRWIEKGDVRPD